MNASIRRILTQCVKAASTSRCRPTRSARRTHLGLVSLEDRTTPVTLTVNALTDTGAGSGTTGDFRYCIGQANALAGLDSIVFNLPAGPQTINLNSALPAITNGDLTITNTTGASNLTIRRSASAGTNFGVFSISAGSVNVTFDGFTITGGNAGQGGAITDSTQTNLTVRNSVITGNTGVDSGAIFVPRFALGTLTIQNTTISGNTGRTGGVYFYEDGSLRIQNSTINNNTGNDASGYAWTGGGVVFYGVVGASGVIIENSTIHGNTTTSIGGGGGVNIRNVNGNVTILNCTITGNSAPTAAVGGGGVGGTKPTASANNVNLQITNTIVAQNTGTAASPDLLLFTGGTATGTNCLIGVVPSANFGGTPNQTGTTGTPLNPMLGPLQSNGGPTATRAPMPGSPVINMGNTTAAGGLLTDQRGFLRSFGSSVDVGAVEDQPLASVMSINTTGANPTGATSVSWTVTFDFAVTGLTVSNFSLVPTGVTGASITSVTGAGLNWTVTANTGTGTGTLGLNMVNPTGVTPIIINTPFTGQVFTIDKTAPTVTSIVRASPNPTNAASVQFTVTFSESVTGVDTGDFVLNIAGVTGASVMSVTGTGNTRTVTVATGTANPGTIRLDLVDDDSITDVATNKLGGTGVGNGSFAAGEVYSVDTVAPTVTINRALGQADPTNTAPITFTVVFSEPVTGFTAADVGLSYTGPGTVMAAVGGSGTTYTVTVTGMTPGTQGVLTAAVNFGGATDAFNNGNAPSTSTDNVVTFDNVNPTVTIDQAGTQSDPTGSLPILFTVVFNEPVTGFDPTDVTISGTANPTGVSVTGSGTTYTVSIANVTGAGTVMATVNANAAMDAAGNLSNASTSTDNMVTFQVTPPTVTVNQGATQVDPTNTSIAFDVVFNQPVTGFDPTDVVLTGSLPGVGSLTVMVAPTSGFNSTYTVTVSGMTPGTEGTVIADVVAGAATGQFANISLASTSADNTVTFDAVLPTVTINQGSTQVDPTNGSTITFDVVFSEAVTAFTPADVTLTTPLTGLTVMVAPSSGFSSTFTVTVTGMTPGTQGAITASIAAGMALDAAGNGSTASTSGDATVTFDAVLPTVTINQGSTQVDPTNGSTITFDVVFSELVSGFTMADVVLGGTLPGAASLTKVVNQTGPTTYTVTVSGMPAGGLGTVTATIGAGVVTDNATNPNVASTSGDNSVLFDNAAPTVTIDQAAGQPDPTNGAIDFTVVFSEPVFGFTDADVILSGSLPGVAGLTKTVTGTGPTYTVTVSGLPAGLEGTVIATVAAGGVTDEATNPNPASTSSDNTVQYDNVRPTVTIDQALGQDDPTASPTVQFTVVFSEPVTGFDETDVVLSGTLPGVTGLPIAVSGSGTTYTVSVTGLPAGVVGTVIADVVDGAGSDAATNTSTASTSVDNTVLYDNEAPSVTINQASAQADPTGAATITFDVVFGEPVFGFTDADVTLSGTLPGAAGLTKVVSGSGDTYTVTVSGMVPGTTGTVVANIASSVAADLAGNLSQAPTSTDNSVNFDGIVPTVTVSAAPTQPPLTSATTIEFTVAFSEPVTGFDDTDVVLSGTLPGAAGLTKVVSGSGANYTITVSGMTPGTQGTVEATIIAGAAVDVAGNATAPPTIVNNMVIYDTGSPTVTINRTSGTGPTNISPEFTVIFSEPVTGFGPSDVSFSGSTVGGVLMATVSGSGTTYTVTVTGMTGVGNVVASITSVGAAVDQAGNGSQPSTSTNNVVPFDGVAPTVGINRSPGQLDPTAGSPISFTVIFTEPVTGFTSDDLNLAASTVGGVLSATVVGSGIRYTVSVMGMTSPGNVIVSIPGGAAIDLAGNSSGASTSNDNVVAFDNVIPTVTVNQAAGQADPATTGPILFTVVFSKPVVGFGPVSLDFTGSTVGGVLVADVTGTGTTYTVSVTGMDGTGVVTVSIPAGVVSDPLGNGNAASTSTDNTIRFDNQLPIVTIDQAVGQTDPAATGPILFTVTFSEPVFGFSASDVSLAGSTAGGALFAAVTGSGTSFTISVTGMSTPGTVVATIPAGAVADASGNANADSTSTDNLVAFDNTAPTVTVEQASGQADPVNGGPILFTVTFGAPVTGFTASDADLSASTAGGSLSAVVSGSGATYTIAVSGMTTTGDVVVSVPAGAAADFAGNANLASTSTDNRVTFQAGPGVDTTPPTATIDKATGQADPTAVGPINFTITFSEAVTGFDASDVSLTGSTTGGSLAASVSGSGTTYTITVTGMTSPGDVVVAVAAGAAVDLVGNQSLAATGVDTAVAFTGGGQPADGSGTFAVGSGAGGTSRIDVFNSSSQLIYSTSPFSSAGSGGTRVAVGDVTGDGVDDYIVGTGPGVSTQVQVINGATRQTVLSYQPFEATFLGGVFVSVGDVTGDGTADIIISPDEGGGPRVLVLQGATNNFPLMANFFGINDPNFRGGARAAAGDINADGFADVAVAAGFQGGPRVSVYDGKQLAQGRQVNLFGDLFIFDGPDSTTLRNGAFIAVGDVNGDGFADLIGGGGPGGSPRVIALSGADLLNGPATQARILANFFAGPDSNRGGVPLAVKDFDGDRFADLVTGSGPGAGTRVTTFSGSTLSGGDPTELSTFDAFGGFNTGVFVG